MSGEPSPLSARLQSGIRFFRLPLPAPPWIYLAVDLAVPFATAGIRAYRVPCKRHWKVRWRLFPGGICVFAPADYRPKSTHVPFGSCLSASLACSPMTRFITASHVFTLLPSLAPCRMMLAASSCPHGFDFILSKSGYLVGMVSDPAVTSNARIPRLLMEEHQVTSCAIRELLSS
jgi:hypothetical protein